MRTALALLLAIGLAACGGHDREAQRAELARTRVGDLDVVLLAQGPAIDRRDGSFAIEFRAASDGGRLVDVGTVTANATMPMAGMAPMVGAVSVEPTSTPGRYTATSDLGMAGEWRIRLEWNGAAGRGSATFAPAVQ